MKARNVCSFAIMVVAFSVCVGSLAFSQMRGGMGMGAGRGNCCRYNSAAVVTLSGTVEEVRTISGPRGWGGVHLTLKGEAGTFDVHLGPSTYVKDKGFEFAKGDHIEVTGSKVRYQNFEAIIAREIHKSGRTLVLRNAQGVPEWAGKPGR